MTIRYCGTGGNNGNSGLTWALRKLTLTGVEATPVVAGDTVYVGPGVYRETLTCGVSGTAGNPITYIGDYLGTNTDGVGGVVRITGSDDDITANRAACIVLIGKSYRTFQGIKLDFGNASQLLSISASCTNNIIQYCAFMDNSSAGIRINGAGCTNNTVQNCLFMRLGSYGLYNDHTAAVDSSGNVYQNNVIVGDGANNAGIYIKYYGDVTVKNNIILSCRKGIYVINITAGHPAILNNNIVGYCNSGVQGDAAGAGTDNYNSVYGCATAYTSIVQGANSNAYPPLFDARWFFEMVNGGRMLTPFDLGQWSKLINLAGTSPTATDVRGTGTIGAQREWGALEYDTTLQARPNVLNHGVVGQGIMRSSQW